MSRTPPQSCPSGTRIRKVKARESGAGGRGNTRKSTTLAEATSATLPILLLSPRNFGSSLLYVVPEMTTRFGNDFNSALNQPALFPILFESFKSHAIQYATNAFDRFDDISKTWRDDLFGHQKISTAASSIRFLNRGCKLLRVMISVLPPRMRAACSFTSISSNRPSLPFS